MGRRPRGTEAKPSHRGPEGIPFRARVQLWCAGFRKRFAVLLLLVTLLLGGCSGAAVTAGRMAWMWFAGSAATTAMTAVAAARPRAKGAMRIGRDGTTWQDYDNGQTLISRPSGTWSLVETPASQRA